MKIIKGYRFTLLIHAIVISRIFTHLEYTGNFYLDNFYFLAIIAGWIGAVFFSIFAILLFALSSSSEAMRKNKYKDFEKLVKSVIEYKNKKKRNIFWRILGFSEMIACCVVGLWGFGIMFFSLTFSAFFCFKAVQSLYDKIKKNFKDEFEKTEEVVKTEEQMKNVSPLNKLQYISKK